MIKRIKLKMNTTKRGMLDRFSPYCFFENRVCNVPEKLAHKFIAEGSATLYTGKEESIVPEVKVKKAKKNEKN